MSSRWSHAGSLLVHAAVLAWVAGAGPAVHAPPGSVYRQEIEPHRHKLVWYAFRDKLPQVSPLERRGPSQPPRAKVQAPQAILANPPRLATAPQLVWRPLPEIVLPPEIRSPHLVAVARPARKAFNPPAERERAAHALPLPEPPKLPRLQVALSRPEDAPLFPGAVPQRRKFVAPSAATAAPPTPAPLLEDAPEVALGAGNLSAAIVGLNPAPKLEAPLPEGSRPGRFSAGPRPGTGQGGGEPVEGARIFVPDLMVRDGPRDPRPVLVARVAPTSMDNLRAAAHNPSPAPPGAVRVADAPIPFFNGRAVYSMAVQMPNVTSYFGSWIIWFAERQAGPPGGRLSAPVPLRKVDPKYVAAAVDERVEGKVRLSAVIRKDGRVEAVSLVQHLDDRLDLTAREALGKWQFEPALRDGSPVEVDAVVEIPFRLRPREAR